MKNQLNKRSLELLEEVNLTNEMIEELIELQANNNSPLCADIARIDEVIGFTTDIHLYKDQVITAERLLDSIASLRWIIERYSIFKAPSTDNPATRPELKLK